MDGALSALGVSLRVASLATAAVMVPATAVGYLLARGAFPGRRLLSALVALPLVLPPTAVGYLLLELFAARGPLGERTLGFDLGVLLTLRGAVLAASIMAFPLVARTAQVAFEGIDPRLEEMARTLGWTPLGAFARHTLPLAAPGLAAAAILGFARALGEFGATVILAGNIPGRTQTLASAIYTAQQVGDERQAVVLLGIALAAGFAAIWTAERLGGSRPGGRRR